MTQPDHSHHEEEKEWPSLLIGWIFIMCMLFGIVFLVLNSKPERKLVCDDTFRRGGGSLTQFGTCHRE